MNELINGNAIKMTSIEIAELVGKRHDNVKRTIETLAKNGVIRLPQIEVSRRNVPMQEYMDRGYFAVKETAVNTNHGIQISFTTKITGRGQQWLTRKLLDNGMLKVTGEAA
ncbi:phage antirepressor KilAC domain-containing protein [Escherichia coli]|uniref:phage antirepressor KilAC domain-containing protein n=1 Tax=Escherichia coli TaxID=562 RepID=UPI001C213851|nr:phage antirepressor KilAC domain-containing protein [Escherichia coli]